MGCNFFIGKDADGNDIKVIACSRGKKGLKVTHCKYCRRLADFLCDYPVGEGKTCDAPLCGEHAQAVGKNVDYCPKHFQEAD